MCEASLAKRLSREAHALSTEVAGRALIIHAHDGSRIACALLGTGSEGVIYRAENRKDKTQHAAKVVPRGHPGMAKFLKMELQNHACLQHPSSCGWTACTCPSRTSS